MTTVIEQEQDNLRESLFDDIRRFVRWPLLANRARLNERLDEYQAKANGSTQRDAAERFDREVTVAWRTDLSGAGGTDALEPRERLLQDTKDLYLDGGRALAAKMREAGKVDNDGDDPRSRLLQQTQDLYRRGESVT